jgi:hypothetical protein
MWPGIVLSSAVVLAAVLGIQNTNLIAIIMLVLVGLILSLGKIVYKTQERLQKTLIFIGVPFILLLTLILSKGSDWQTLAVGLIGKGEGFWLIPSGLSLITFLGAFAYSGAGGNLNLAQSFYVREKGYGMGKYGGKITSLLRKSKEKFSLEGRSFEVNQESLKTFKEWWKKINLEHALVFWLTGAITIILLSLLAYVTVYQRSGGLTGINFLFKEGQEITKLTLPLIGKAFLVLVSMMLFSTQLSIMDATSRINSENLVIINQNKFKAQNLSKFYFIFLWTQIALSILILSLGFKEPLQLITISAFLNAITMLIYTIAVLWLNQKTLAKELRPIWWSKSILLLIIVFFAGFSLLTLLN